jgi:hypothetical protein
MPPHFRGSMPDTAALRVRRLWRDTVDEAPVRQPDVEPEADTVGRNGIRMYAVIVAGIVLGAYSVQLLGEILFRAGGWTRLEFFRETARALLIGGLSTWVIVEAGRRAPVMQARNLVLLLHMVFIVHVSLYDVAYLDPQRFALSPSWVCLNLLIYALLVPGTRRHHLLVAGVCSAMLPLGAIVGWALSGILPALHQAGLQNLALVLGAWSLAVNDAEFGNVAFAAFVASIPTWICAAVAVTAASQIQRTNERLAQATSSLERLGSYTLVRRLGEGGMGEVWLARHAFLARPAAIKVIRPTLLAAQFGDPGSAEAREAARTILDRFALEARVMAGLTSPHTVRLFDFGTAPDGTFFYAMEHLSGLDVDTIVRRFGPMNDARVRQMMIQVCDSLAEAHERGLVHRDIKPSNIFLCNNGCLYDFSKVLDFGLVLPLTRTVPSTETNRLTQTGLVQGTPWYMAPEQAVSGSGLDGRVDVYALACVAYFALTATEVYPNESAVGVMLKHVHELPERPSTRRPDRPVHPQFEELLLQCLEKRRENRPPSALALREMLHACPTATEWTQGDAEVWASEHGVLEDVTGDVPAAMPLIASRPVTPVRSY